MPGRGATNWPPVTRLGTQDRYELEEPLSTGGAATVWRAYDNQLDRTVAIKILHPHLVDDPDAVARFSREAKHASRLSHPNAVAMYDAGQTGPVVYLVMEYVDGPTLKQLLDSRGAFADPQAVAAIGSQLADVLSAAHRHGIVHRDIKPANILFTSDGQVKVADFGIAKALTDATANLTADGHTVGTAAYIAPEQYRKDDIDGRADQYALAMVLYECLTGRPAWGGDTPASTAAARLVRDVVPPRQIRADVPAALEQVIVRCALRDPRQRYADAIDIVRTLDPIITADPDELLADALAGPPPTHPRRWEVPSPTVDADATDPGIPTAVADRHSRRRMAIAFVAGTTITAAIGALLLPAGEPAVGPPLPVGAATVIAAGDYDPFGDGHENPDDVWAAHDGDPATVWRTERYVSGSTLGTKPGAGLWFDLGDQPVTTVTVETPEPGVTYQLYRSDRLADGTDGQDTHVQWGRALATVTDAAEDEQITVGPATGGRYWLLFVQQGSADATDAVQPGVAEVTFTTGPDDGSTRPPESR